MRMVSSSALRFSEATHALSGALTRWFPRPRLLFPSAAGIDISDTSIKWLTLEETHGDKSVRSFGQEPLEPGIVVNGIVQNATLLAEGLKRVRGKFGAECAHTALPEEAAYVFDMHIPEGSSREATLSMVEFELEGRVPIPPSAAVYDFDVISRNGSAGEEIGVTVFPRELAESYAEAFALAGIPLLSLEVEARSVARAVSEDTPDEPITLLVDFGRLRTGFAVLKRGIPIFTSTVAVGGETIDRTIIEKLSLPPEKVDAFKNEQGLLAEGGKGSPAVEVITATVSALADEVMRHYHYWDTRRNEHGERMTPVERVFLVGGSANLKGLGDYIAARVQVEVVRPSVWQNVCSFDNYIPPIDRRTSLRYATSIGLALRNF